MKQTFFSRSLQKQASSLCRTRIANQRLRSLGKSFRNDPEVVSSGGCGQIPVPGFCVSMQQKHSLKPDGSGRPGWCTHVPHGSAMKAPLRIMRPDDANVAGNVHGGTVLKMIEEAGAIISTRHCNSQNGERCVAALARVERTDFLSPMCIGEVAHVSAEITYTSKHSVEVQVHVMSENILTGTKKLTNKATLWYVPLSLKNVDKVLEVPPVVYSRQEQEEEGRKRYEAQKLERMETKWRNGDIVQPVLNPEPNTVSYSQSSLIHLVGPSDCTLHGFVHGGVTMKLMDEVAGIVAARHCKTNIVTASVDAINFHDKIRKGCVITISGRMTFTSNKSMEIEVLVDADPVVNNFVKRYRAASAFFTYVSLSPEGKSLPVPQLVPETEDEKKRFEEGKGRYLQMKAKRQGQVETQA